MDIPLSQPFKGFEAPEENWSKLPHALIEALPLFKSMAEMKVVMYVLRHTWGYREYDAAKPITLDEFAKGRKRKDGTRIDAGTGLAKSNIIKGLKEATEHGFLSTEKDDKDLGRKRRSYQIRMYRIETSEVSNRNIRGIESGHPSEKETEREIPVEIPLEPSVPHASKKLPKPSKTQESKPAEKPDLIFEWVCTEVLSVSLDDIKVNPSLRGRANKLSAMIINAAKVRRGLGKKDKLSDECRAEIAARLPGMKPFYFQMKPNTTFPTGDGTFGALNSQWFGAGCPGPVTRSYVPTKWYDEPCEYDCDQGTVYHKHEDGSLTAEVCKCVARNKAKATRNGK